MQESYDLGWIAQVEFLDGKTLAEAKHILAGRMDKVDERVPYNKGGNDATRDYVERLSKEPAMVPAHFNDVTGHFCSRGETMQPGGRCPDGCDHAEHYSNDGHPECEEIPKR